MSNHRNLNLFDSDIPLELAPREAHKLSDLIHSYIEYESLVHDEFGTELDVEILQLERIGENICKKLESNKKIYSFTLTPDHSETDEIAVINWSIGYHHENWADDVGIKEGYVDENYELIGTIGSIDKKLVSNPTVKEYFKQKEQTNA